ncbi:MAG TPA: hypothetical protein VF665_07370 [Longimicrobium sp.]|jgi:hypothetical protein|uniref:hypothetical protein n=1 Tax=Longimicrobium sp. TaxID=2029185 RepID=UPI002EDB139C
MSLNVSVWAPGPDGNEQSVDLGPGGGLLGFESYRGHLWGTRVMKDLGLHLLPSLGREYGFVVREDGLDELQHEARTIHDAAEQIEAATRIPAERVQFYAQNLLQAVAMARETRGSVHVA